MPYFLFAVGKDFNLNTGLHLERDKESERLLLSVMQKKFKI